MPDPPGTQWLQNQTRQISSVPLPRPAPGNLLEQARSQWPVLRDRDIGFTMSPRDPRDRQLEAWFPGIKGWNWGGKWYDRPTGLSLDKYGIEVFEGSTTRPIDILGDVVSHFMVNDDPRIKDYYSRFSSSLTKSQMDRLVEQYHYDKKHMHENRDFPEWLEAAGLPSYFRGYPFQQWKLSPQALHQFYTSEQLQMLDEMMQYLSGK